MGWHERGVDDEFEQDFKEVCEFVGLVVERGEKVICQEPVTIRSSKRPKYETKPDWKVTDIATGKWILVEVTGRTDKSTHKRSQKAVIEHAKLETGEAIPYVVVIGTVVRELHNLVIGLESLKNPYDSKNFAHLKELLYCLFEWD